MLEIAHLADIHIKNIVQPQLKVAIDNLYKSLKSNQNLGLIVIAGDLFDNYIEISNEAKLFAGEFLNKLSEFSDVVITRGNHDVRKKNKKRIDSVETVVKLLNNNKITCYAKTGIYDYKKHNIQFIVWDYLDKENPYELYSDKLVNYKLQIDLYHDPINGCLAENNEVLTSTKYISQETFKGDLLLAGDIHKQQDFYRGDKIFGAYPSSLIELKYSEGVINGEKQFHGYLLWKINSKVDFSVKKIAIESSHTYNTYVVNRYTDFNNLDFDITHINKENSIRIIWKTFPATFNNENKDLISKYFIDNNVVGIKQIQNKKEFVIEDADIITDQNFKVENVINLTEQQKLIRIYLEELGHTQDDIERVVAIDNTINTLLPPTDQNSTEWFIEWINGINFMSYESIDLDFNEIRGVTQITGKNRVGKTTIFKLIQYVLFGKTIETEKVVKFGDSRFVNNKNGATSTSGRVVINCNGEYFGISRETILKYNRDKTEITSSSTSVTYFTSPKIDEIFDDQNSLNNLSEEEKVSTQKRIDSIIGTHDDFVRAVITTADTLNRVLSYTKANFIDTILYYLGIDICDLKLTEFKEYRKKYNSKNLQLNISVEQHTEAISKIENSNIHLNTTNDQLFIKINECKESIAKGYKYKESQLLLLEKIDEDVLKTSISELNNSKTELENSINKLKVSADQYRNEISKLKESYDTVRYSEIELLITSLKESTFNYKSQIQSSEHKIDSYNNDIRNNNGRVKLYEQNITSVKNEIDLLQKSEFCPTCGNKVNGSEIAKIQESINAKRETIHELNDKITALNNENSSILPKIELIKEQIQSIKTNIESISTQNDALLIELGGLKNDKAQVEKRIQLNNSLNQIPGQIENYELKINLIDNKIEKYHSNKDKIDKNAKIGNILSLAESKIKLLETERDGLENEYNNTKLIIGNNISKIRNLQDEISLFKVQQKTREIFDIYENCLHRNGLPTKILKGYSIPMINNVLSRILDGLPITVWVDSEEMALKISDDSAALSTIDAIAGSGMERTFAAIALKVALNKLNLKNRPSLFLLDEIMGKLDSENTMLMYELLSELKLSINNIFIIEQRLDFDSDYGIEIIRNNKGISNFKLVA